MAWLTFGRGLFSGWWLLVPVFVFLALVIVHQKIFHLLDRAKPAVKFYSKGLQRLDDQWMGKGNSGKRFIDPAHPYSGDLDIFGHGSLFELLCSARTMAGEECLAAWLCHPADPAAIYARQESVEELRNKLDLREDLALLGEEVRSAIDPDALARWGKKPPVLTAPYIRPIALFLAAGTIAAGIAFLMGFNIVPFLFFASAGRAYERSLKAQLNQIILGLDKPTRDLALFASLIARIEKENLQTPLLQRLQAQLAADGLTASSQIARLDTLFAYLNQRSNAVFAVIGMLILWTTQWAYAIERWRAQNGQYLERWLQAVGEFEALCSLSAYAYEHPDAPFPEIIGQGNCFEAESAFHPLLPAAHAVPNDIQINEANRLFIVSGSNMSGKSTLLRTIGANTVLALAGAPVCAKCLRLTPMHIGASIRTQDSLQGGISRFYAEIKRLRQIVDIGREHPPLLFLLDEILQGTNSHDRRVGAEAVLRTLMKLPAVGLATTHDLALAKISDDPALKATNVHFEDQLEEGKMSFDYRLRPGVVQKSNAIELMRAVGLEV